MNIKRKEQLFLELTEVCREGKTQRLKEVLKENHNILDLRDGCGRTLLHFCTEHENTATADVILSRRPDLITSQDDDGYTVLHLSAISGNTTLVKFFLSEAKRTLKPDQYPKFVNCYDNENHTALHWATVSAEHDTLILLHGAGADPSLPDIHGAHPIHYASQMESCRAKVKKNVLILKEILSFAPSEKDVRDKDGRTPLIWAASSGNTEGVMTLLSSKVDVSLQDKDGLTALHCAASRGFLDCIESLITMGGAVVDQMDSNGCTPLFYAVTLGHGDCCQLLIQNGAEVNHQDRKGRTPAHCGAAKGQLETLKILHSRGGNLWMRNIKGDLPLHDAVRSGRKELVLWLLDHRPASIDFGNTMGKTPLHVACFENNVDLAKILLDYGVDVNGVMKTKGQLLTPLDVCLQKGFRSCAKFLLLHGALPSSKISEHEGRRRFNYKSDSDSAGYASSLGYHTSHNGHCIIHRTTHSESSRSHEIVLPPAIKGHPRTSSRLSQKVHVFTEAPGTPSTVVSTDQENRPHTMITNVYVFPPKKRKLKKLRRKAGRSQSRSPSREPSHPVDIWKADSADEGHVMRESESSESGALPILNSGLPERIVNETITRALEVIESIEKVTMNGGDQTNKEGDEVTIPTRQYSIESSQHAFQESPLPIENLEEAMSPIQPIMDNEKGESPQIEMQEKPPDTDRHENHEEGIEHEEQRDGELIREKIAEDHTLKADEEMITETPLEKESTEVEKEEQTVSPMIHDTKEEVDDKMSPGTDDAAKARGKRSADIEEQAKIEIETPIQETPSPVISPTPSPVKNELTLQSDEDIQLQVPQIETTAEDEHVAKPLSLIREVSEHTDKTTPSKNVQIQVEDQKSPNADMNNNEVVTKSVPKKPPLTRQPTRPQKGNVRESEQGQAHPGGEGRSRRGKWKRKPSLIATPHVPALPAENDKGEMDNADTLNDMTSIETDNSLNGSVSVEETELAEKEEVREEVIFNLRSGEKIRATTTVEVKSRKDTNFPKIDEARQRNISPCTHRLHHRQTPMNVPPPDLRNVRPKVDTRPPECFLRKSPSLNTRLNRPEEVAKVASELSRSSKKYAIERKLFEELQDLKKCQIKANKAHEMILVKKLADRFNSAVCYPGVEYFSGTYDFASYEQFLYEQLQHLSTQVRSSSEENLQHPQHQAHTDYLREKCFSAEVLMAKPKEHYHSRYLDLEDRDRLRKPPSCTRFDSTFTFSHEPYPPRRSHRRVMSDVVRTQTNLNYGILTRDPPKHMLFPPISDSQSQSKITGKGLMTTADAVVTNRPIQHEQSRITMSKQSFHSSGSRRQPSRIPRKTDVTVDTGTVSKRWEAIKEEERRKLSASREQFPNVVLLYEVNNRRRKSASHADTGVQVFRPYSRTLSDSALTPTR